MGNKNLFEFKGVSRENQVEQTVFFCGEKGGSPRIMFIGNSVTLHAPLESIGWYGNWGMAASSLEKDYVHVFINGMINQYPNAEFCIVQASCWERNYKDCNYEADFSMAMDFKPDIIICSISANIHEEEFEHDAFKINLKKLHDYLSCKNTKIIESSVLFGSEKKNKAILEYVAENEKVYLADVTDILQDEKNRAIGLFAHEGIQAHPGDSGMKLIAERFLDKFKEIMEEH